MKDDGNNDFAYSVGFINFLGDVEWESGVDEGRTVADHDGSASIEIDAPSIDHQIAYLLCQHKSRGCIETEHGATSESQKWVRMEAEKHGMGRETQSTKHVQCGVGRKSWIAI